MNEIKLKQSPVITHELQKVGLEVKRRIEELNINNLVATNDSIQAIKKTRAELNNEFKNYKADLKSIIDAVSVPIIEVKEAFKTEITENYEAAEKTLKTKIQEFEIMVKTDKLNRIKQYFTELCQSENIDFLEFSALGIDVNLSTSEKKYKEKCIEFIERIKSDLVLIDSQKFNVEILVEYKKSLNASKSITEVVNRKEKERIEIERQQIAEFSRRKNILLNILVIHHESTRTFEYNSDIYISEEKVEKATKEEFESIVLTFEQKIKDLKAVEEANKPTEDKPKKEPKPVKTVSAPKQEKNLENIKMKFEVSAELPKLKALKQYLIDNNINFKPL